MKVNFHPHALQRMTERGATEDEVIATGQTGERFPAKYGSEGFRRDFVFQWVWRGRRFDSKQIEAFAV